MTTDFIQAKMVEKYNKGIKALNAISEGVRTYSEVSFEDTKTSPLGKQDMEFIKTQVARERQARIVRHVPHEIEMRLDETGTPMNWNTIIEECEYVKNMIEEGGSHYEEEDTTELLADISRLIVWSSKLR